MDEEVAPGGGGVVGRVDVEHEGGSGSSGRLWFGDLVGGTANVREHITHGGNVVDESVAGTLPDGVPNIVPMSDGEGFTDGIHEAIALG